MQIGERKHCRSAPPRYLMPSWHPNFGVGESIDDIKKLISWTANPMGTDLGIHTVPAHLFHYSLIADLAHTVSHHQARAILNLNHHTKSKILDHVGFVPDSIEIHKPLFVYFKAATSNSLLPFYYHNSCSILTYTASGNTRTLLLDWLRHTSILHISSWKQNFFCMKHLFLCKYLHKKISQPLIFPSPWHLARMAKAVIRTD